MPGEVAIRMLSVASPSTLVSIASFCAPPSIKARIFFYGGLVLLGWLWRLQARPRSHGVTL